MGFILFTQEVSARVTSGQRRLSDLNQRYFELKVSWELRRSGLCCKIYSWTHRLSTKRKPDSFISHGNDEVWEATSDAQLTPGRDFLCQSMSSGWVEGFTSLIWTVSWVQLSR